MLRFGDIPLFSQGLRAQDDVVLRGDEPLT